MLDERLSLVRELYRPCELGADIGSDHGFLPRALLLEDVCRRMIVTDISPKALSRAEANLRRAGLTDRVTLKTGDGFLPLDAPCGCVSVTGMGGETIAEMLAAGRDHLRGAALVLSSHTDLPTVRSAVQSAGYAFTAERLCHCRGRYYLVWRAEPGAQAWEPRELRVGRLLWQADSPLLREYAAFRAAVLQRKLDGLRSGAEPDRALLAEVEEDLAFYRERAAER